MSKPNETIEDSTTVEEVDVNLDEIFGVGGDNILLPEEKKTIFTKEKVDTSFIDKPDNVDADLSDNLTDNTLANADSQDSPDNAAVSTDTIDELDKLINEEEENENKNKGGRPKLEKSALYEMATKMIEEGALMPFDDDKPLEEYSAADFRELFEANFQEREAKVKQTVPQEFFQSLPRELQVAAKYVADGGQDLKGLFKTLAQVEETFELDPQNENHQEEIARQYLYATQFGSPEEIEAEIEDWKDLGRLEKKANQFKPKLDAMQEEIVARKLAEQEVQKKRQEQASKQYTENVYNTLAKGELGGVKLDRKTQSVLYSGLVQPSYPSISGRPTNLLGHLLEKYQFGEEPRHDLIAEALWLLQDPDGYKSKIKSIGSKESTEKTVRALKTESQRMRNTSGTNTTKDVPASSSSKPRTLQRPGKNIFSR
jgi:hypothetical protein